MPRRESALTGLALGATSANTAANAGDVFSDDSEEEMDEEQKAKHKEFKGKRQAHYSNEAALALKRAREMPEEDDDEDDSQGQDHEGRINGVPSGGAGMAGMELDGRPNGAGA